MDLTTPIARGGEPIYASIMRNRSGFDSGEIDYGHRVEATAALGEHDKQSITDTAYALYESVCRETGKQSKRDTHAALLADLEAATQGLFASWELMRFEDAGSLPRDRFESWMSCIAELSVFHERERGYACKDEGFYRQQTEEARALLDKHKGESDGKD